VLLAAWAELVQVKSIAKAETRAREKAKKVERIIKVSEGN